MKRFIIGTFIAATISVSSLSADTKNAASTKDTEALYKCMITKMDKEQKRYIKEYGFLSFAYPDKVAKKFLNSDEKQFEKISIKAGEAFTNLIIDKCGNETKALFMDNPLPVAYKKFAQIINGVAEYVFINPKDRDTQTQQKFEKWLRKGMGSNKDFKNFIHNILVEKVNNKK